MKDLKKYNSRIYFDAMDNFAIHPSLNKREKNVALTGYCEALKIADFVSANSAQTCDYFENKTGRRPMLIKNGVFVDSEASDVNGLNVCREIEANKNKYQKCVGYIGKIGARLDDALIDEIARQCNNALFVFVGPHLKDQKSSRLTQVLKRRENILLTGGIPSAYVHAVLDQFDLLMIPHSVGVAENGGDPEKLYHYLTRKKPIISTGILGVDEFENEVFISNSPKEWVEYIRNVIPQQEIIHNTIGISWESRFKPIMRMINDAMV